VSITATITTQPISSSVSGSTVAASVPTTTVQASAGGVGPQGPQGPPGNTQLSDLTDVFVSSPASGDVLRYSDSAWRNRPEILLIDGGNFVLFLCLVLSAR
jgi:hypothetical protein